MTDQPVPNSEKGDPGSPPPSAEKPQIREGATPAAVSSVILIVGLGGSAGAIVLSGTDGDGAVGITS